MKTLALFSLESPAYDRVAPQKDLIRIQVFSLQEGTHVFIQTARYCQIGSQ
jgi:hypothetical protein